MMKELMEERGCEEREGGRNCAATLAPYDAKNHWTGRLCLPHQTHTTTMTRHAPLLFCHRQPVLPTLPLP